MSHDYWNAYKSYQPGSNAPNYNDLCKAHGHYAAEQAQRGWQAAARTQQGSPPGTSSSTRK